MLWNFGENWDVLAKFSGESGLRVEVSGKLGGVGNFMGIMAFVVDFCGNLGLFCEF